MKKIAVKNALALVGFNFAKVSWLKKTLKTPNGGYTIQLKLLPGGAASELVKLKEKLASALNVDEVDIRKIGARKLELTARQELPRLLPEFDNGTWSSIYSGSQISSISIGKTSDGFEAIFPVSDDAGGVVSLIAGNPGSGKSSLLKIILSSLMQTNAVIVWFDPKGGADARIFKSRVDVVGDCINAPSATEKLVQLNELVMRRANALASGKSLDGLPPVVVFVDEWANLGVNGNKKEKEEVDAQLRKLAAMGRASKVSLILSTQRPTATTIDVATRGMASVRVVFGVGDVHASIAALGYPGAELLHASLDRGKALYNNGASIQKIAIYQVPAELEELANSTFQANISLSSLATLENSVFNRAVT